MYNQIIPAITYFEFIYVLYGDFSVASSLPL